MNNRITKTLRAKAGFTLVELIVVIAILGILAGVGTVGYSGYIKKANMAADEQLLGYVNQAFAAACLENGVDMSSLPNGGASMPLVGDEGNKTVDVDAVAPAPYQPDFAKYFAGNENSAFKVYNSLKFLNGTFIATEATAYAYGDGQIYISDADAALLSQSGFNNSTLGGIGGLLGKVDSVVGFGMTQMMDEDGLTAFGTLVLGDEYMASLATALGVSTDAVKGEVDSLAAKMIEGQTFATDEEREAALNEAAMKIYTNNAVLCAAKGTTSKAELLTILRSDDPKQSIIDAMGGDAGFGLSQASVAYGMYTAYVYNLDDDYVHPVSGKTKAELISSTSNPVDILNGLDDDEFLAYMQEEQAEKDLDGYLAAMNMINGSAEDPDAVAQLLVNGFSDPELAELLQKAIEN